MCIRDSDDGMLVNDHRIRPVVAGVVSGVVRASVCRVPPSARGLGRRVVRATGGPGGRAGEPDRAARHVTLGVRPGVFDGIECLRVEGLDRTCGDGLCLDVNRLVPDRLDDLCLDSLHIRRVNRVRHRVIDRDLIDHDVIARDLIDHDVSEPGPHGHRVEVTVGDCVQARSIEVWAVIDLLAVDTEGVHGGHGHLVVEPGGVDLGVSLRAQIGVQPGRVDLEVHRCAGIRRDVDVRHVNLRNLANDIGTIYGDAESGLGYCVKWAPAVYAALTLAIENIDTIQANLTAASKDLTTLAGYLDTASGYGQEFKALEPAIIKALDNNNCPKTPAGISKCGVMQQLNYLLTLMNQATTCLLYTSPSPRDRTRSRMPSSA